MQNYIKLINNKRSKFTCGILALCWLNSQRIYFISVGEFFKHDFLKPHLFQYRDKITNIFIS